MKQQYSENTFFPGQDWLYFKIYCSDTVTDRLLNNSLMPFAVEAMTKSQIKLWFFIRYNDPHHHIRFRLKITRMSVIGSLINKLYKYIAPFIADKEIYKIELSTYVRETPRYRSPGIDFYEDFFFADSKYVCDRLADNPDEIHKISDCLLWMNTFIIHHFSNLESGRIFAEKMAAAYLAETGNATENTHNINAQYRKLRSMVDDIVLNKADTTLIEPYRPDEIKSVPVDILTSVIHMHVNRMFNRNSRLYELLLYQLLALSYKSCQYKLLTKN